MRLRKDDARIEQAQGTLLETRRVSAIVRYDSRATSLSLGLEVSPTSIHCTSSEPRGDKAMVIRDVRDAFRMNAGPNGHPVNGWSGLGSR